MRVQEVTKLRSLQFCFFFPLLKPIRWQRMRWLDGITNSRAWVWVNSRSWWWTGRPGVLRFMGSQRVRHDWATELNWTEAYTINNKQEKAQGTGFTTLGKMWVTSAESQGKRKGLRTCNRDRFGFGLRKYILMVTASSEFLENFKEIGTTPCQTWFIGNGLRRVVIGLDDLYVTFQHKTDSISLESFKRDRI